MKEKIEVLKEEIADAAREKIIEDTKKKAKKELRKRARRARRRFFIGVLLFLLGVFAGIHWRVILAYVKGEPLPEPPEWHTWCK